MRRGTRRTAILCGLALALGVGVWFRARETDGPRAADGARVGDAPASPQPPPRLAGSGRPGASEREEPGASPAEAATATAPGALAVTVVGTPGDAPLVGATVTVRADAFPARTATTDAGGVARFAGLERASTLVVEARAPGRVREVRSMDGGLRPEGASLRIALKEGAALSGLVLEARSRRPVPGATVVARVGGAVDGMSVSSWEPELASVTSDRDGRFRIDGIPLREVVTLHVRAEGWSPAGRTVMLGEGAAEHPPVEIELAPGASVTGRVADATGRPVPGAEVHALLVSPGTADADLDALDRALGPWGYVVSVGVTRADGEGRFAFEGLRTEAPYRFLVRGPAGTRSRLMDPPVTLSKGRAQDVGELRLGAPGALTIELVDARGAPLVGGSVHMEVPGREVEIVSLSPSSFRYAALPAGRHEVSVGCPGYVRITLQADVEAGRDLVRRAVLHRGLTIAGVVVDDLGAPVGGAWVSADLRAAEGDARGDDEWTRVTGATSEPDGRFRVVGLPAGAYRVSVESPSGASGQATTPAPAEDVRLVVPRSGGRRVRVVLPPGAPTPEGLALHVEDIESRQVRGTTRAFGDGSVAIPRLPPRAVRLAIDVEGYAPWIHEEIVAPGSDLDLGEARLDAGGELVATVRAATTGAAIGGARVRVLRPAGLPDAVGTTDVDGVCRLRLLPHGPVDVRIAAEGFHPTLERLSLDGGVTRAGFTLVQQVQVRGRVRSASGRATAGLDVVFLRPGEAGSGARVLRSAVADATGAFEAELPVGEHVLEVHDPVSKTVLLRLPVLPVPTSEPLELRVP